MLIETWWLPRWQPSRRRRWWWPRPARSRWRWRPDTFWNNSLQSGIETFKKLHFFAQFWKLKDRRNTNFWILNCFGVNKSTLQSSIKDVTVLGGRDQCFFDNSTETVVLKHVTIGEGYKMVQNCGTSFMDQPFDFHKWNASFASMNGSCSQLHTIVSAFNCKCVGK